GQGERLTVRGEGLALVGSVTFLGAPGRTDDRGAAPQRRAAHQLTVMVPEDAAPGPVRVLVRVSSKTQRSRPSQPLEVEPAAAAAERALAPAGDAVYPLRGKYTYGASNANRFGGGGRHQGQDVFAGCGTPLVAAQAGKVERAGFEGAMGNHVVVTRPDGASQVYMHLAGPPHVQPGDSVSAGQRLGAVGETGRATGCHLHFEIWNAPGWTRGVPIDPMPALRGWEGG
ncbi:MAG: M23 family metallopeptidase, partial [Solirubrobacterales bacterium]|nr:M23 family metallopeptidase [Solirubrobacterales bacterium]